MSEFVNLLIIFRRCLNGFATKKTAFIGQTASKKKILETQFDF